MCCLCHLVGNSANYYHAVSLGYMHAGDFMPQHQVYALLRCLLVQLDTMFSFSPTLFLYGMYSLFFTIVKCMLFYVFDILCTLEVK